MKMGFASQLRQKIATRHELNCELLEKLLDVQERESCQLKFATHGVGLLSYTFKLSE